MFTFTITHILIAVTIVLLFIAFAYIIGDTRAKKQINHQLNYAIHSKTTFLFKGVPVKVIRWEEFNTLVKKGEAANPSWDWAYAGGQQR